MSFDWSMYLALARSLLAGSQESEWRSAISRAYYAAFNQAKRLSGNVRTAEGSHDQVWNEVGRNGERRRVAIMTHGQRLKRERVLADYHANPAVTRQQAESALRTAETLLQQIQALHQASA